MTDDYCGGAIDTRPPLYLDTHRARDIALNPLWSGFYSGEFRFALISRSSAGLVVLYSTCTVTELYFVKF